MTDNPTPSFEGFEPISGNFTMTPNQAYALMPDLSGAEFKLLFYIVRHTFGFQDASKRITLDEFEHGRKRADGSRIDGGTGIARSTIITALQSLTSSGYINREVNDTDKAREKHVYSLRMRGDNSPKIGQQGSENQTPEVRKSDPGGVKIGPRSEKETLDKNKGKNLVGAKAAPTDGDTSKKKTKKTAQPRSEVTPEPIYEAVEEHIFGIASDPATPYAWQTPTGLIAQWLMGRISKLRNVEFGTFKGQVEPRHIEAFAKWYRKKYADASLPRDVVKFVGHWREFVSVQKAAQQPPPPIPFPQPPAMTDAERAETKRLLQEARGNRGG